MRDAWSAAWSSSSHQHPSVLSHQLLIRWHGRILPPPRTESSASCCDTASNKCSDSISAPPNASSHGTRPYLAVVGLGQAAITLAGEVLAHSRLGLASAVFIHELAEVRFVSARCRAARGHCRQVRSQPRPRHRSTDFVDSIDNNESAYTSNPTLVPWKLPGGLLRVVARPPNKGIALDTGTPMLHSRHTTGTVPTAHATRASRPQWPPVVAIAAAGVR